MVMDLTQGNDALKQHYMENPVEQVMYKDRPLFGLVPKFTTWGGANAAQRAMPIPIGWANGNAVSASFPIAQSNGSRVASKINAFQLTSVKCFGFAQIDNETMKRSADDMDAFVDLASYEIDGVVNSMSNRLHQSLYGDGTGVIGSIANTSFATSVCTLNNPEDIVHIEVNDELTAAQNAGSSQRALGSNNHGWYVIAVDRDAGTFTVGNAAGTAVNLSDASDGIPNAAQNDSIFHRGDQNAVLSGLEAWNPFVAPASGDSFYNVNRSQDTVRLAGSRHDGTSADIVDALLRGADKVAKQNGKIGEYFINYKTFGDLVASISSKRIYGGASTVSPEDADVGYETIKIVGPRGTIRIIPDQACPSNRAHGVDLESCKLCSVGEPVQLMDFDGVQILRVSNSDSVEVRYVSYSNFAKMNPRNSVTVQLPLF